MAQSIMAAVKRFLVSWNQSSNLRYLSAKIYSRACDEWNTMAKSTFKGLEEFSSWRPTQWTLLYFIGKCIEVKDEAVKNDTWDPEEQTGVVSEVYMNFNRPTIPLAMRRKNITIAEQERLFHNGAILSDINGKPRHVSIRYMQIKDLNQLYDNNGHKRSIIDQIKWLQNNQKPNFEILADGTIHVKHNCFITPNMMEKLLGTAPYPLKATTLFQLAQKVNK